MISYLTPQEYLSGIFRPGVDREGVKRLCFTPDKIHGRSLLLPHDILKLSDVAAQQLSKLDKSIRRLSKPEVVISQFYTNLQASRTVEKHTSDTFEKRNSTDETKNYLKTQKLMIQHLRTQPLMFDLICAAHETLLSSSRGSDTKYGRPRQRASKLLDIDTLEIKFVAAHYENIPELMRDLERFWTKQETGIPSLVRIAIGKFRFVQVHPFEDGNGRLSRLICEILLWKYGFLAIPLLRLDHYFEINRRVYHDALQKVNEKQDLYGWIRFFLQGLIQESALLHDTIQKAPLTISDARK